MSGYTLRSISTTRRQTYIIELRCQPDRSIEHLGHRILVKNASKYATSVRGLKVFLLNLPHDLVIFF